MSSVEDFKKTNNLQDIQVDMTPALTVTPTVKNTLPVEPVVDAKSLSTPIQRLNIKKPQVSTTPGDFVNGLSPVIDASFKQFTDIKGDFQRNLEANRAERSNVLNRLLEQDTGSSRDTFDQAFGQQIQGITGQSQEEFMKTLGDANLTLAQLQGKYRTRAQNISGAQGQSQVFESAQLSEAERQRAVEVGNQALIVQALQGNFDTARQIALDTANFATEDKQVELRNLYNQFEALDGRVSEDTQKLVDIEKQNIVAQSQDLERTQGLIDSAILTGLVDIEEMQYLTSSQISNADKQALAQEIIGRGAVADRQFQIDKQFGGTTTQLPVSQDQNTQRIIQSSNNPEQTQNVLNSIRNSKGKSKTLTQSQEEDIITTSSVISQLDTIINLISSKELPNESSQDIFGVKTGKLRGRISQIAGELGANPEAAALNAAITGLIPKVARGVFGEVGVLTDADVARYERTVPNMFLPENANEAVSIVLLDSLGNAMASKLNVWSQSRDVSGFEDVYLNILNQSQELKDKIQGVERVNTLQDYFNQNPQNQRQVELLISENPELTEDEIFQILGFNQASNSFSNDIELSSLSSKFESNNNPGAVGYDRVGGTSYGSYQLTKNNITDFINNSPFRNEFVGMTPATPEFTKKWKEIASRNPREFEIAQREYIKDTHYLPQINKLASRVGISEQDMSPTLRSVIWSTAVQHGPNTDVIEKAIKKVGINNEPALITEIYNERAKRFPSSTPQVRKSVQKRFEEEKRLALKAINFYS